MDLDWLIREFAESQIGKARRPFLRRKFFSTDDFFLRSRADFVRLDIAWREQPTLWQITQA